MKKLLSAFSALLLTGIAIAAASSAYSAGNATVLATGQVQKVYNAEIPTSGQFSPAVYIISQPNRDTQLVSVQLTWPTDPGAFNIQIQDADTDVSGAYTTCAATACTITSAPASAAGTLYTARSELQLRANFVRLYVNTQTANSVALTATISR